MGVSSFLAVRRRLRSLRGFGKSTERNPAIIPCAPELVVQFGWWHITCTDLQVTIFDQQGLVMSQASFVFLERFGLSVDRWGIGKTDHQVKFNIRSDIVDWIRNMQCCKPRATKQLVVLLSLLSQVFVALPWFCCFLVAGPNFLLVCGEASQCV